MDWQQLRAYITGSVDQALLLRNEYLVTEKRLPRTQIKGHVRLNDGERKTLTFSERTLSKRALRHTLTEYMAHEHTKHPTRGRAMGYSCPQWATRWPSQYHPMSRKTWRAAHMLRPRRCMNLWTEHSFPNLRESCGEGYAYACVED
jgi:hypothetical protein